MRTRHGFARLPLIAALGALTAAGLTLVSVRAVHAPEAPKKVIHEPVPAPGAGMRYGFVSISGPNGVDNSGQVLNWNGYRISGDLQIYDGRTFILTYCSFVHARLAGTRLAGSCFRKCDLRRADLAGADLRGLRYDRFTRWPAGFDPVEHGAVLDGW